MIKKILEKILIFLKSLKFIKLTKINNQNIKINISTSIELWRARTYLTKEPETINWIDGFKKNEVFFDVGANIGLYSIYAAKKNCKVFYKVKNKKLNFLKVLFLSKKIKFIIKLAIFKQYENYVKIIFKDNSFYHLNHFFYGKKIKKLNYFCDSNKKITKWKIDEDNLFKNIFNYSNQKLLNLSRGQYFIIKRYLISLSRIKKHIKL